MHESNGTESNCIKEYNYSGLVFHALIFQERITTLQQQKLVSQKYFIFYSKLLSVSVIYSKFESCLLGS